MNRLHAGDLWRFCATVVVEVLNPLLLISLALFVSVGYMLTLLMPVNVDMWASLALICILFPLALLSLRARRNWRGETQPREQFSWRALLPLVPMLVLMLAFLIMLSHPSLLAIAHIDLYFSNVIQAFHRFTPLENVFVPGYPANHYWLFYALIAAIVKLTSADTLTVISAINFVYLASALLWLARVILALKLAAPRTVYLGIAVIFVFSALNATGPLSNLAHLLRGSFEWGNLRDTLLSGADRRLHSVFVKVFNASAMTLGLAAFTAAFFVCLKIVRERFDILSLVLLSASGIAALGVMPVVTLFVVCVLLAGMVLTAIFAWRISTECMSTALDDFLDSVKALNPWAALVWLGLSLMLSLPLLHYFDQFTANYQSGMSYVFFSPINLRMTIASSVLLLPLVGLQIAFAFKSPTPTRVYMAFCSILGLLLVLGVMGMDQNQYKLHYLLCMMFSLAALLLVEQIGRQRRGFWRVALWIYVAGLVALALLNSAYGLFAIAEGVVRQSGSAVFDGIHIQPTDEYGGRLPTFYWIRENTPRNAIVIVPHAYTTISLLFHERLNYVSTKYYYYTDLPVFDRRVGELHEFYDPATQGEVYESLLKSMESELPGRPLYAVVKYSELDPAQMRERGAKAVFDSPADKVAVYLLNPP